MIQFNSPQYAWFLLLIPVLILLFFAFRYLRNRQLKRFGDLELMGSLMPLVSRYRAGFKMILICTALFFIILALMRPQTPSVVNEVQSEGVEVIIALDVSNSMLATDFSPTRLDRAKMAISRLVDGLSSDRIGLIVFAGEAYLQLPVTSDYVSAKVFLNSINPGVVARQGTDIEKAIELSMKAFTDQTIKSKALIIITDGENQEADPRTIAEQALKSGIVIHTIGIGSVEGAPIRMPDGSLLKDKAGNIVVSKLDQFTLQEVAKAGGGTYTIASPADLGLGNVLKSIKSMEKQKIQSELYNEYAEWYRYPLFLAIVLLLLEMMILERKNKLFHNFDIFQKKL